MSGVVYATIDSKALEHNWRFLRNHLPSSCKIWAVVKANAYGHDLELMGRWFSTMGADALGVARIDEMKRLRAAGVECPIIVMSGCHQLFNMETARDCQADIVVHSIKQVDSLMNISPKNSSKPLGVWLKVETGMNRLGITPNESQKVRERLLNNSQVVIKGSMSHYANADDNSSSLNKKQYDIFKLISSDWQEDKSIANSAAILESKSSLLDWVRPGIMCYGVSPIEGKTGFDFNLKPVMSLKSSVIAVQDVKTGDAVGYGSRWVSDSNRRIAVVACGYGDGYPQNAPDGTPVWVKGSNVPIVGRVSMDLLTIDITGRADIDVGDEVVLWGPQLPVETIASFAGRSSYELLTHVADRVERKLI